MSDPDEERGLLVGHMTTTVSTQPLKSFAKENLKHYPMLRRLILEEADRLPDQEFVTKVKMWLRLLSTESDLVLL